MLRPWDFKIVIRRGGQGRGFLQIAHALIEEIKRGRLAPGQRLARQPRIWRKAWRSIARR